MIESLLILGIAILLFFGLRGWMLWYWKVDKIIENQNQTNILLRNLYLEVKEKNEANQSEIS